MISLKKLIPIFIIISHISYGNTFKNTSQVSNLLFSNINEKKIEIDEISKTALSIEILLPKKIVLNELITFYENLGDLSKEKKIIDKCKSEKPEIIESILSSGKLEEDSEQKLVEVIKQLKQTFNS